MINRRPYYLEEVGSSVSGCLVVRFGVEEWLIAFRVSGFGGLDFRVKAKGQKYLQSGPQGFRVKA